MQVFHVPLLKVVLYSVFYTGQIDIGMCPVLFLLIGQWCGWWAAISSCRLLADVSSQPWSGRSSLEWNSRLMSINDLFDQALLLIDADVFVLCVVI